MPEALWYLAAGVAVFIVAPVTARRLLWIFSPPASRRKLLCLYLLCGFICSILAYAWLLDSRRIEYHEEALWTVLGVGALGVLGMGLIDRE